MESATVPSTHRPHRVIHDRAGLGWAEGRLVVLGLLGFSLVSFVTFAPAVRAQEASSEAARAPTEIRVEVSLDPSKTGRERCLVEPEDLRIPSGLSNVTWSLRRDGASVDSAEDGARLETVGFDASLPVTENERIDAMSWQAVFDAEEPFAQIPYDVHIQEADGSVVECYPHVAGSTDQGG